MGWFRKESSTHFERDESGRVISVERSGDVDSVSVDFNGKTHTRGATPVSDKLIAKSPRKPSIRDKAASVAKRVDKKVVAYNRRQRGRPASGRPYGTRYNIHQNYNPFGSMFDTGLGYRKPPHGKKAAKPKYVVVGGKAYPVVDAGKKKTTKRKKSSHGLGGFDMMDNWGYMK